MRFLSFNIWHGLTPSSLLAFDALEVAGRRKLRQDLQIQTLKEIKPDIAFLQEVNPIVSRSKELARALSMSHCVQPDLVGTKFLGFGFPYNLNSGLAIMSDERWGLKKVRGLSLTRPGSHLVQTFASWQLKEERFALLSEVMVPKWGRVLLVDTHLHHGLESSPEFEKSLLVAADELELSESAMAELQSRLKAATDRRMHEIQVLLDAVRAVENRYEVVVMGGDFNCTPDSPVAELLRSAGFRDAWVEGGEGPGLTFDGSVNVANHRLQAIFPLTLIVEDLSFSTRVKETLLALARKQERRPRRIDYLWFRSHSLNIEVRRAQMVGLPDENGLAPSDHFGVSADLEI
jgi:endonuclease/exonuclease/phosphatase family metal-dependent hydrolase